MYWYLVAEGTSSPFFREMERKRKSAIICHRVTCMARAVVNQSQSRHVVLPYSVWRLADRLRWSARVFSDPAAQASTD